MAATDGLVSYTKKHVTIDGPDGVYVGKELDGIGKSISAAIDSLKILGGYAANSAVATGTFLGNISGSAAVPVTLSAAQVTAALDLFTETLQGLVPPPGTATGTNYLSDTGWQTVTFPSLVPYMQKANNLSDVVSTSAARTNLGLGTAATQDVGTGANNVVQRDASGHYPTGDGSAITNLPSQTGRTVLGVPLVMDPLTASTTATQAHGLGAQPVDLIIYFECKTAEGGFSVGDRVHPPLEANPPTFGSDTTNVFMVTSSGQPGVWNKSTHSIFNFTLANWKAVATPYKLT